MPSVQAVIAFILAIGIVTLVVVSVLAFTKKGRSLFEKSEYRSARKTGDDNRSAVAGGASGDTGVYRGSRFRRRKPTARHTEEV